LTRLFIKLHLVIKEENKHPVYVQAMCVVYSMDEISIGPFIVVCCAIPAI